MSCPHGMPTPGSCVDCMDEGLLPPPREPEKPTIERTFNARFPGRCRHCDRCFHVGDPIAYTTDETYVHEECGR